MITAGRPAVSQPSTSGPSSAAVELLTSQGSKPLAQWRVHQTGSYMLSPSTSPTKGGAVGGKSQPATATSYTLNNSTSTAVEKVYERDIKGCCHVPQGAVQLTYAPSGASSKVIHQQPFLGLQVHVPPAHNLSVDVTIKDGSHTRRRILVSTTAKEVKRSPLHSTLPLLPPSTVAAAGGGLTAGGIEFQRGIWTNLILDLPAIVSFLFPRQVYGSLETLTLSGPYCRFRRVFLVSNRPQPMTEDVAMLWAKSAAKQTSEIVDTLPRSINFVAGTIFRTVVVDLQCPTEADVVVHRPPSSARARLAEEYRPPPKQSVSPTHATTSRPKSTARQNKIPSDNIPKNIPSKLRVQNAKPSPPAVSVAVSKPATVKSRLPLPSASVSLKKLSKETSTTAPTSPGIARPRTIGKPIANRSVATVKVLPAQAVPSVGAESVGEVVDVDYQAFLDKIHNADFAEERETLPVLEDGKEHSSVPPSAAVEILMRTMEECDRMRNEWDEREQLDKMRSDQVDGLQRNGGSQEEEQDASGLDELQQMMSESEDLVSSASRLLDDLQQRAHKLSV